MSNTTKYTEIINQAMDEMIDLRAMVSSGMEIEEATDTVKMFLQDLQIIKSEATIELLRLRMNDLKEMKEE